MPVNVGKCMISSVHRSANAWKTAYFPAFADILLVFSYIFWDREFKKTHVFQRSPVGEGTENCLYSGVRWRFPRIWLHFMGRLTRVNSRKRTEK